MMECTKFAELCQPLVRMILRNLVLCQCKSKCFPKVINNARLCYRNMPPFQTSWGLKMIPGFIKKIFEFQHTYYLHRRIRETCTVSRTESSKISFRSMLIGGRMVVFLWSYEVVRTTIWALLSAIIIYSKMYFFLFPSQAMPMYTHYINMGRASNRFTIQHDTLVAKRVDTRLV